VVFVNILFNLKIKNYFKKLLNLMRRIMNNAFVRVIRTLYKDLRCISVKVFDRSNDNC